MANDSKGVNADLIKERKKCNFDVQELIHFIDGGEQGTKDRREVEELALQVKEVNDEIPEEYLSHMGKYQNAVRKATALIDVLKDHALKHSSFDAYRPTNMYRVQSLVQQQMPLLLHMGMFVPTIIGQASPDQQAEWLPKALSMQIIGTYAQTELGHGTFLRGLETTATYDPNTEEFVLHTPSLTAYKWWPGGLGQTANHCIVVAQLYTKGQCHGVHPFIVQIRDSETHMPLPGIKVGEIGPKLGYQTANNGFLAFDNFRIPRDNMLMKNAQVQKDGTYIKAKSEKLTYGTMMLIRVMIVTDMAYELSRAATIAIRYSAVRHQSQPKPDQPEPQILDYVTQQHKLFIAIATSHAYRLTGNWLWSTYSQVTHDLDKGKLDHLPELHALSCCLKAVCSYDSTLIVERCRLACGGHGYMTSSNFPVIYGVTAAAITLEGEYSVLLLQTARYLVKAWEQAREGKVMTPTVSYMVHFIKNRLKWANRPEGIIASFQAVAAGKTKAAYDALQKYKKAGNDYEDSWNLASVQLANASEAHCRAIICEVLWKEMQRLTPTLSPALAKVLLQLAELYLVYWALEKSGDLLEYSSISSKDLTLLRQRYEELLAAIRPNAVGLVDGFDIRDQILNSTLGAYDGRVYERLMDEALKSPLNQKPVDESFHKYLKPFMQKSKL
ncbi:probable peroxisomal acyl-coenzyme A oxidase 1 [Ostrinia nubilalis]|uniref:probable peroxisomal acyl-coenzyme A oxidase 1 n=1 Tax=Ostrinia nubilalis TaxID=29057 RepID=UPI00308247B5